MYIIFDVDDTLYDLMSPFLKAHEELFGPEGDAALAKMPELAGLTPYKKQEWLFKRSRYHSEDAFYRWSQGEITQEEEFHYRVIMTYMDIGIDVDESKADVFKERYRYYQKHITPFEGIEVLMAKLADFGAQLAVITNGKHDKQMQKLESLGVLKWVPEGRVFISEDMPAPKPEVKAFRYVEDALGIGEEEVWYIGDNYDVDVLGAKAAGWKAIWFNHRGKSWQVDEKLAGGNPAKTGCLADVEVRSVAELEKALWKVLYKGNHFYSLNQYLKETFGEKVYKIALDGGMTCPNRDGTLGIGGCIFCSSGGSGEFAQKLETTITAQIDDAKARIQKKTDAKKFIAYFQSYTNTYAPVAYLRSLFTEAINHPEVVALSIGTRPDCLPKDVLDLLEELNQIKPVWVELGLQTIHESTAKYIRRGYELPVYEAAVSALHERGILVITHVILGLPQETEEMMLETVKYLGARHQRGDGIKLQLLHVLEGTDLAAEYQAGKFEVLTMDAYIDLLMKAVALLPPGMVIHRLTGDGAKKLLIAPKWSGNKKLVLNEVNRRFREK